MIFRVLFVSSDALLERECLMTNLKLLTM